MRLPVFYKQKFALFFPSWAYAIPFGIIRIPITAIEVTAWSLVVYFTVGFEYSAGRCGLLPAALTASARSSQTQRGSPQNLDAARMVCNAVYCGQ